MKPSSYLKGKEERFRIANIHQWLRNKFGSASVCEHKDCLGKSKWFDWALLKEKSYEKIRENFVQMCRSCHRKYDQNQGLQQQYLNPKFREAGKIHGKMNGKKVCLLTETQAKTIKEIYKKKILTQMEIADLCGVDQSIISRLVNKKTYA